MEERLTLGNCLRVILGQGEGHKGSGVKFEVNGALKDTVAGVRRR